MEIGIWSSFSCEWVDTCLKYVLEKVVEIQPPITCHWIPYGRSLADLNCNDDDVLNWEYFVIIVRLSDLWKPHPEVELAQDYDPTPDTRRSAESIQACLSKRRGAAEGNHPSLLLICPPPDTDDHPAYRRQEDLFISTLKNESCLQLYSSKQVLDLYGLHESCYYNPHRDLLMHEPYTHELQIVLSTLIARTCCEAKRSKKKVLVLDCDNTLWAGAVGEVGSDGIRLTRPHLQIQEFALEQFKQGMILCLCSKNVRQDVLNVFETRRSDMRLHFEEHITLAKISWDRKSQALHDLAAELGLGLESLVFLDDSPAECHDVASNCPGVAVLQLPSTTLDDDDQIQAFLRHAWVFDCSSAATTTQVDRLRTRMYKAEMQRRLAARQFSSSDAFIASLGVEVKIEDMAVSQIDRVVQLAQRTNQFNTTCWRLSRQELEDFARHGQQQQQRWVYTVTVTDRFGHFGLVGVMLLDTSGATATATVPLFLLSCRVLNRQVEDEMWQYLRDKVRTLGCDAIELKFLHTERNLPAQLFFQTTKTKILSAHHDLRGRASASSSFWDWITRGLDAIKTFIAPPPRTPTNWYPKVPIHTMELLKKALEPILPSTDDSTNVSLRDRCKFRRKARHQAKLALNPQSVIWSATGEHIHDDGATTTLTTTTVACKTPQCSHGRSLECTLERCRTCCYRLQRLIVRYNTTEDDRCRASVWRQWIRDYGGGANGGLEALASSCIVHRRNNR